MFTRALNVSDRWWEIHIYSRPRMCNLAANKCAGNRQSETLTCTSAFYVFVKILVDSYLLRFEYNFYYREKLSPATGIAFDNFCLINSHYCYWNIKSVIHVKHITEPFSISKIVSLTYSTLICVLIKCYIKVIFLHLIWNAQNKSVFANKDQNASRSILTRRSREDDTRDTKWHYISRYKRKNRMWEYI